jgi:DNA-binding transcriptional LysR family regulator
MFRRACDIHRLFVPSCVIQPTRADTAELIDEIASGEIDAALVTLPAEHPELCIEELRRDRLVACIRADHPLAVKVALHPADLHDQLRIFYHKKIHPEAHAKRKRVVFPSGFSVVCETKMRPWNVSKV